MLKIIVQLFLLVMPMLLPFTGFTQPAKEQRIQDSIIGWWDNNRFDKYIKPSTDPIQKNRVAQLDKMVSWVKQSYTPVGGLGTTTRENFSTAYGIRFLTWNVSFEKEWLDEKGHFRPIAEENTQYGVWFNSIPASYPVPFINAISDNYYFTWPADGYGISDKMKGTDPRIHPNVYPYITRINESNCIFLAPDNKLPFEAVTIKEYLDMSEASLPIAFEKEKKKIDGQWPGDNARDAKTRSEVYAYQEKEFTRYRNAIAKWREKHKNDLSAPAILRNMQPTIIGDFFGDSDPFEISAQQKDINHYYPLYKVPADVMKKARSDKPQWIAIWVPYQTKENGNQLYELYTAITQNINYEYIYNYFFNPARVQGKPYTPANEQQLKERQAAYKKKSGAMNVAAAKPLAAGVHFADDFSSNATGSQPAGWYFRTYGKFSEVTTLAGQSGKWVKLGNQNELVPLYLKKPLPANFSLEFDLATDAFTARTGGTVALYLSTYPAGQDGMENRRGDGKSIALKITPGNYDAFQSKSNYMGDASIEIRTTPQVNVENHSEGLYSKYVGGEFTNIKRTVHVTLQLQNGDVKLLFDNKLVTAGKDLKMRYGGDCTNCKVLQGSPIRTVSFKNITTDWSNFSTDKDINVYITNVKITQL